LVKERLESLDNLVNQNENPFRLHPVLREAGFGSEQDGHKEQNQTRKSPEEGSVGTRKNFAERQNAV